MSNKRYTINDLQSLTNTNRRTIHFYSQRGLIPRPDSRGGAASYPEDALNRLKIIKELQKRRYTLDEIFDLFEKDYERLKERFIYGNEAGLGRTMSVVSTKEQLREHLEQNAGEILQMAEEPNFYDYMADRHYGDSDKRELIDQTVRKIKVAEGIELQVDEETFKRYRNYIRKGVLHFQDILAERRRGRPRKDRIL